ncbi:hypothetical protein A3735_01575 [Oleiphilus sp. HI0061]|nr:hypothetical protein A3735_01575 [Oleiphilus sp. HI0061]
MKAGGQEPDHLSILIAWLVTFICFVYSLPLFGMKGTDTGDTFKTLLFSMTSISGERWNTRLDFLPMNDSIIPLYQSILRKFAIDVICIKAGFSIS